MSTLHGSAWEKNPKIGELPDAVPKNDKYTAIISCHLSGNKGKE
jgi:hypothetical protein